MIHPAPCHGLKDLVAPSIAGGTGREAEEDPFVHIEYRRGARVQSFLGRGDLLCVWGSGTHAGLLELRKSLFAFSVFIIFTCSSLDYEGIVNSSRIFSFLN